MDGQKGSAQIGCPDPSEWLAVAAGSEPPDRVAKLSEHAATCADCAAQLHEAVQLLADDDDAAEARFVAGLKSSQPDWQKRMAQRLAAPASGQVDLRHRWLPSHPWFLPALRAAAVVTAISLVVSISWRTLTRRGADSGTKAEQATQPATRASQPPQEKPLSLPPQPQQDPLYVAQLTLEPGTTRGLESAPLLVLRPETRSAAITLLFLDVPPEHMNIGLVSSSGKSVWSKNLVLSTPEVNSRRARLEIPASLLPAGDYILVATQQSVTGHDLIATYACRVIRH